MSEDAQRALFILRITKLKGSRTKTLSTPPSYSLTEDDSVKKGKSVPRLANKGKQLATQLYTPLAEGKDSSKSEKSDTSKLIDSSLDSTAPTKKARKRKTVATQFANRLTLLSNLKSTPVKEAIKIGRENGKPGITEKAYNRYILAPDQFDRTGKVYGGEVIKRLATIQYKGVYLIDDKDLRIYGEVKRLNRNNFDKSGLLNSRGEAREKAKPIFQ